MEILPWERAVAMPCWRISFLWAKLLMWESVACLEWDWRWWIACISKKTFSYNYSVKMSSTPKSLCLLILGARVLVIVRLSLSLSFRAASVLIYSTIQQEEGCLKKGRASWFRARFGWMLVFVATRGDVCTRPSAMWPRCWASLGLNECSLTSWAHVSRFWVWNI